jgi:hypothetical protein
MTFRSTSQDFKINTDRAWRPSDCACMVVMERSGIIQVFTIAP